MLSDQFYNEVPAYPIVSILSTRKIYIYMTRIVLCHSSLLSMYSIDES